jgi:hypothetical protein
MKGGKMGKKREETGIRIFERKKVKRMQNKGKSKPKRVRDRLNNNVFESENNIISKGGGEDMVFGTKYKP